MKSCLGYISETVRCRKLILGRVRGYGCVKSWCDLDLTFDLAIVTLTFITFCLGYILETIRCRKLILGMDIA